MTDALDPALRGVAELVVRVARTLQAGDDASGRAQAAAEVAQLQAVIAQTAQPSIPGFDLVQIGEALRLLAEWLRAPTSASEANAERAFAELRATMGPLVGWEPPGEDAARGAQYRQQARTAIDDYFRDHPIKPMKP
jgi:hypothetical protein